MNFATRRPIIYLIRDSRLPPNNSWLGSIMIVYNFIIPLSYFTVIPSYVQLVNDFSATCIQILCENTFTMMVDGGSE